MNEAGSVIPPAVPAGTDRAGEVEDEADDDENQSDPEQDLDCGHHQTYDEEDDSKNNHKLTFNRRMDREMKAVLVLHTIA